MEEPPPDNDSLPTLGYGRPAARQSPATPTTAFKVGEFIVGIVAGIAVSCVAYGVTLQNLNHLASLWIAIALVLGGKIALACLLIRSPRWSPLGKGIIGSSALIVLLIGACFGVVFVLK